MKIKVYFFGKPTEVSDWEQTYLKRIGFRCKTSLCPLAPAGLKQAQACKEKEAERLLPKLSSSAYVIVLDEGGEGVTSPQFAKILQQRFESHGEIVFVVGGAQGLANSVLQRADLRIAFSQMVWTKDLVRLMLLEQIYRGLEIQAGSRFHKN